MTNSEFYRAKATALLVPTPFEIVDPVGERDRVERICQTLGILPTDATSDFFTQCHADAFWAQVGSASGSGGAQSTVPLRNPFSGEQQLKPTTWDTKITEFDKIISDLEPWKNVQTNPDTAAKWYRKLWRAVMALDPVGVAGLGIPNTPALPDHGVLSHRTLKAALAGARFEEQDAALLMMHIGPVQGFIRAARRTHDSWMGSYLVGYLTWCAIRTIAEQVGPDALVYPYLADAPLAWRFLGVKGDELNEQSLLHVAIPNRFLAIVPSNQAERLVKDAATAAQDTWKTFAERVNAGLLASAKRAEERLRISAQSTGQAKPWDSGWDEQIGDHLEIDAVTVPWSADKIHLTNPSDKLSDQQNPQSPTPSPSFIYSERYDTAASWLSAHRGEAASSATIPTSKNTKTPDIRPKCGQCGQRSQMGPIIEITDAPERQLTTSRDFWLKLSADFQNEQGGRTDGNGDDRLALDLGNGEGLCAVCLTKRFVARWCFGAANGENKPAPEFPFEWDNKNEDRAHLRFPSVESIATAPYRKLVAKSLDTDILYDWVKALKRLHGEECLDFTPPGNLLPGLGNLGADQNNILSYDGSWWNEDAYEQARCWRDYFARPAPAQESEYKRRFDHIGAELPNALRAYRAVLHAVRDANLDDIKTTPYYAVLMMDVDGMGKWLRGDHDNEPTYHKLTEFPAPGLPKDQKRPLCPARHAEISRRVAQLAATVVPEIVHTHLGRAVYCGGDDLVAFLPIHTVFACADEIRNKIQNADYLGNRMTISAGVAIAHSRMPMGEALEAAHNAEQLAKQRGGNHFGIVVRVRSGDPFQGAWPWELQGSSTLPTILEQIRTASTEQGDPLFDGPVITRLNDEADVLGQHNLLPAFKHRLHTLLVRRYRSTPGALDKNDMTADLQTNSNLSKVFDFVDKWMASEIQRVETLDNTARKLCRDTVQLLMIARFLRREGGGIHVTDIVPQDEHTQYDVGEVRP